MSGSHADSIEMGGAYDGALGVLGAIAALKALREAGFKPVRSLEAMMFTTEEAGRFNVPCLGRWEPSHLTEITISPLSADAGAVAKFA